MIAQMAGDNEIDDDLIALLDQNIEAARKAGQEEAADFMKRVRDAANRFVIATPSAEEIRERFQRGLEVRGVSVEIRERFQRGLEVRGLGAWVLDWAWQSAVGAGGAGLRALVWECLHLYSQPRRYRAISSLTLAYSRSLSLSLALAVAGGRERGPGERQGGGSGGSGVIGGGQGEEGAGGAGGGDAAPRRAQETHLVKPRVAA